MNPPGVLPARLSQCVHHGARVYAMLAWLSQRIAKAMPRPGNDADRELTLAGLDK
jgi:hypothetical protein